MLLIAKGRLVIPGTALDMTMNSRSGMTPDRLTSRIDWRFSIFGAARTVVGRIVNGTLSGTSRDGENPTQALEHKRPDGMGDLLTAGFWFAARPADVQEAHLAAFTGFYVYEVVGKAGPIETIALPAGPREARRWEITATRPGRTRTMTLWTDPKKQIPLKAHVELDFLGSAEIALTKR